MRYGTVMGKLKAIIRGTIDMDKLIKNGLKVGKNFHVQEGVIIDPGHCWLISIGDDVTLAPNVHILAHDASTKYGLGYTKLGTVTIGNGVFIGANSIVLPGVEITDRCIIGAGSVVARSLEKSGIYVGNPCRMLYTYEEYIEKNRELLNQLPVYDENYIIGNISNENKKIMLQEIKKNGGGYIV